ncbi:MAG: hypothetical protein EON58_06565 [Alphaproteobacteria bacterium]|nr:MAG: hypothetical protein EON58_06565 [Alphaproteobacteria bacterium]
METPPRNAPLQQDVVDVTEMAKAAEVVAQPPPALSDREVEALTVEYKENVATLRNWDTIFAGWLSSLLIGGGIGTVASLVGKQIDPETLTQAFKVVFCAVVLVASLLGSAYLVYVNRIAVPKKTILASIEEKLGMVGSYKKEGERATRTVLLVVTIPVVAGLFVALFVWRSM